MFSFRGWGYGLTVAGGAAIVLAETLEPALALARPPRGGPGPLIGMGLPLAGLVVAALAVARRFRGKE
jgi:hypothetical protein